MKIQFKKLLKIFGSRNGVKMKKLLGLKAVLSFLIRKKRVREDPYFLPFPCAHFYPVLGNKKRSKSLILIFVGTKRQNF